MPLRGKLLDEGVVRGDQFTISRSVRLASGVQLSTATLTVKLNPTTDLDVAALFQKIVTPVNQAGIGWIEDVGTDGYALVHFDILQANTLALAANQQYFYDMQFVSTDGDLKTLESGVFTPIEQVGRVTT